MKIQIIKELAEKVERIDTLIGRRQSLQKGVKEIGLAGFKRDSIECVMVPAEIFMSVTKEILYYYDREIERQKKEIEDYHEKPITYGRLRAEEGGSPRHWDPGKPPQFLAGVDRGQERDQVVVALWGSDPAGNFKLLRMKTTVYFSQDRPSSREIEEQIREMCMAESLSTKETEDVLRSLR
jgi:tetrahydromethanopterin S-methyltransferase subunit F